VSKIFDYGNKLHIQLGQKVEGKQWQLVGHHTLWQTCWKKALVLRTGFPYEQCSEIDSSNGFCCYNKALSPPMMSPPYNGGGVWVLLWPWELCWQ
jgi:hypothetical protein